jgi:hypothetical protein
MTRQFAVVFNPDGTHVVEAVGPFRSPERAQEVMERLERAIDSHAPDEFQDFAWRIPRVVTFITEQEAIDEYGVVPHSPDSESDQ